MPPYDVTDFYCVSGQVFVQTLCFKNIFNLFWKTEYAIINAVPNEKYPYTLKPRNLVRNALNLGAKVVTFMLIRYISQNEALVAMQENSARLSLFWVLFIKIKNYF